MSRPNYAQDAAAEKVRVSIAERFVPAISLAIASASGSVGGVLIWRFLGLLQSGERVGYPSFFGGISRIEVTVGACLTAAALLRVVGLAVCVTRMFTANKTASPSGVMLFALGL